MYALNRSPGPFEEIFVFARERNNRPMATFTHTRGDESDNSLVPGVVIQADTIRPALLAQLVDKPERLLTHRGLNVSSLTVNLIQHSCVFVRRFRAIRQEAFDADRDIFEPSRRVDSRTNGETHVGADTLCQRPARLLQQRFDTGNRVASAHAHETLLNQYSIVVIQRHNIGHRTQRHQVQKARRNSCRTSLPLFFQHTADSRHEVKSDTDTGEIATRELTAFEIRVNDDGRIWNVVTRQMMICNQYRNAELICDGDAFDTGDTIVDRD